MDAQDDAWLIDFQRDGSETAFTNLVQRHLRLVHGCAARQAGSQPHLLDDIVQRVFIDFAKEAKRMKPGGNLAGWFHRHTCFIAGSTLRSEKRRRLREQNTDLHQNDSNSAWKQISPIVDESINALREKDRLPLVLRFFEDQNLQSVGKNLGISEDAAQKRITRALEKLRAQLTRRGVVLSGAALATALTHPTALALPPISAASIASSALTATTASLGLFQLLLMSKTKIALASTLVAAGVGTTLVLQATRENESLRNRLAELETAPAPASPPQIDPSELARLRADQRDAIKLRGDLALLKLDLTNAKARADFALKNALAAEAALAKARAEQAAKENYIPEFKVFSSKAAASIPVGQSLVLGGWHTATNTATYTFLTPDIIQPGGDQVSVAAKLIELERDTAARELASLTNSDGNILLDAATAASLFEKWKNLPGAKVIAAPTLTTLSGRQGRISVTDTVQTANGPMDLGPELDFTPTLSPDSSQIHVNVEAKLTTLVK